MIADLPASALPGLVDLSNAHLHIQSRFFAKRVLGVFDSLVEADWRGHNSLTIKLDIFSPYMKKSSFTRGVFKSSARIR